MTKWLSISYFKMNAKVLNIGEDGYLEIGILFLDNILKSTPWLSVFSGSGVLAVSPGKEFPETHTEG